MSTPRLTAIAVALLSLALVSADIADARVGGGGNSGSRGNRTYTAPPATNTAPKAAPIERSMTQRGAAPTAQPGAMASRFGGWRGLLMGGLIAAGLASIFGFGALASALGFLLQFALIAGVIYLVVMFIRSRTQPALARASAYGSGQGTQQSPQRDTMLRQTALGSSGGTAAAPLTIGQDDLDSFEKLLGNIQTAYSREDANKLAAMTTPEMLSYFNEELADNARQGVRNEISDVKLLQGDVSEAWTEDRSEYATVAMRYSLVDATVDRATGRVVSGDRTRSTEATEFWTFRRDDRARPGAWQLSAIQQAA